MSNEQRVVAVLGRGLVPADEPVIRVDDRGVLRGDGIFESMHVRAGRPWLVDAHLDRLARAATTLRLPLPAVAELRDLLDTACAGWPADAEGRLRLICTRGPEDDTGPTVYAILSAVPEASRRARRDGIRVATLPLGVAADARTGRPWLLSGLKTTSYALSEAARRWAAANGVDDVLWTSTDGYALEGPSANLVWLAGERLCTVPAEQTGILPGVTADWLLRQADELAWKVEHRLVTPAELHTADGAWFTSSVRGLAEVRELDGVPLPASPHTAVLADLLGFPVPSH
ncbi:aminotransferase class IV [Micromonospora sp. WMMD1102]|uniref:aminotransferase class IV n=1 Tax=Micromonospora sp. WMMD1102 TaxID=3016105 RepID=UPI002414F146|nr:aminotransferase class IV [Micromonospora sp. WMMD1102]MDG4791558.1 aminotransferase class IV [Micromonospora sp. WMMD1102]